MLIIKKCKPRDSMKLEPIRGVGVQPLRRRSLQQLSKGTPSQRANGLCVGSPVTMQTRSPVKQASTFQILYTEVSKGWLLTAPFFGYVLGLVFAL